MAPNAIKSAYVQKMVFWFMIVFLTIKNTFIMIDKKVRKQTM